MIRDVGDNRPGIMDPWAGDAGRKSHDGQAGVALRDRLLRIAADALAWVARNLDFAEDVTGPLKIVCGEELGLRVIVDPHDDSPAIPPVGRTRAESDSHAMVPIGPDGAILDPVRVRFFVPTWPPIHVVGANRRNVEKLHLTLRE